MDSEPQDWPSADTILTTPHVPASAAHISMSARTHINAPAALVFDKVLRVGDYPRWNTFTPKARIMSQPEQQQQRVTNPQQDDPQQQRPPSSSLSRSDAAATRPDKVVAGLDTLRPGSRFELHAVMDPARPARANVMLMRVTDVSTPAVPSSYVPAAELQRAGAPYSADLGAVYRAAWCVDGGLMARFLKAERFVEVVDRGAAGCDARTWELQGGVAARAVKWMFEAALAERFRDFCRDLKEVCEKEAGERAS